MRLNKAVLGNFEGHNSGEGTTHHAHLSYTQEQLKLTNKQDSIQRILFSVLTLLAFIQIDRIREICYQSISKFSALIFFFSETAVMPNS